MAKQNFIKVLYAVSIIGLGSPHSDLLAAEDPTPRVTLPEAIEEVKEEHTTGAKWLWQEQLKPTLEHAGDSESLWILLGTAAATSLAHQQDEDVRKDYGHNQKMSKGAARFGSIIGSGIPGIAIVAGQIYFDTENGLQHARALGFTALTHITLAETTERTRPNGKNLSFPSGHTSSSFATATSLYYDYGPYVGVPALFLASFIGASRIASDSHWLSDTVAGAGLGIFWARASEQVRITGNKKTSFYPLYLPTEQGVMLGAGLERKF